MQVQVRRSWTLYVPTAIPFSFFSHDGDGDGDDHVVSQSRLDLLVHPTPPGCEVMPWPKVGARLEVRVVLASGVEKVR